MITAKDREAKFRAELAALLEKHGAEMNITDDGKPWGMQRGVVVITMPAIHGRITRDCKAEFTEFRL